MPEYPEISTGLGVLTPSMWSRMMTSLRQSESGWHDIAGKVRDRGRGLQPAGMSTPSNLVRIYNGGSYTINKYEACYVDDAGKNAFGDSIAGLSAQNYGDIYEASWTSPVIFTVKSFGDSAKPPKYNDMRDWFVATNSIDPGEYGWGYMSGVHYALVWDPLDLSTMGGSFATKGWLYADLPDATYENGLVEFDSNVGYAAYSATQNGMIQWCVDDGEADNGKIEQAGNYDIYTPLMLRPNGRSRVLWIDTTTSFSAGDCQFQGDWPIGGGSEGESRVRLAIVERCGYGEAVLPSNISAGDKRSGEEFIYDYKWSPLNGASLSSEHVGRATNLAELDNCSGLSSLDGCTNCYTSDDNCDRVAGYPIPKLNECFGTCNWEMQPIGGWFYRVNGLKVGCVAEPTGQSVAVTVGLDSDGYFYPHFALQNAITSVC